MNKFETISGVFETIPDLIAQIEKLSGNKVLFASELGSRVWGYHRPQSDHDIQIVMREPAEKIFSLFHEPRSLRFRGWVEDYESDEEMVECNFTCWTLQRALELASLSDITLVEAVRSPIVWHDQTGLRQDLEDLWYNMDPRRMFHRYRGTAKSTYMKESYGKADVKPRDIMQITRHIMVAQWMLDKREDCTTPPMSFEDLFSDYSDRVAECGLSLDQAKALFTACKTRDFEVIGAMTGTFKQWVALSLEDLEKHANKLPEGPGLKADVERLWRENYPEVFPDDDPAWLNRVAP
jgi:predicted nucleotidyltransferase